MRALEYLRVHQCFPLTLGDTQLFLRAINAINENRLELRQPHVTIDFSPYYYKGPPFKSDGTGHVGEYGIVSEEQDWLHTTKAVAAQLLGTHILLLRPECVAERIFHDRAGRGRPLRQVIRKIRKPSREATPCPPGMVDIKFLDEAEALWEDLTIRIPGEIETMRLAIQSVDGAVPGGHLTSRRLNALSRKYLHV
ncbi:hypothetical protein F5Y10DRAFT_271873 [Nemania abortiva]|nr:hypothetical protein F5Y10DRAFT_271873 [Nemania abortiva]